MQTHTPPAPLSADIQEIIASTAQSDFDEVTRSISKASNKSFSIQVDWGGLIAGVQRIIKPSTDAEACTLICKALGDYKLRGQLQEAFNKLLGWLADPRYLQAHKSDLQRQKALFERLVTVPLVRIVASQRLEDRLWVANSSLEWEVSCSALVEGRHKDDAVCAKFCSDFCQTFGQSQPAAPPALQAAKTHSIPPPAAPKGLVTTPASTHGQTLRSVVGYENGKIAKFNESALKAALAESTLLIDEPVDDKGNTALHFYSRVPIPAGILMLIEHGADPNVLNMKGETPLHRVLETGMMYSTQVQDRTEDWLVEAAAILVSRPRLDPNIKVNNDTALHKALHTRYFKVAETIVNGCKTLDFGAKDHTGSTALELAIRVGANKVVAAIEKAAASQRPKASATSTVESASTSAAGAAPDKELASLVTLMADMLSSMAELSGDIRATTLRTMTYNIKKKYGL